MKDYIIELSKAVVIAGAMMTFIFVSSCALVWFAMRNH
jgi:hypothetical protein